MTSRVLLVEDDDDHARIIDRHLAQGEDPPVVERVTTFTDAMVASERQRPDVILLDLGLRDSPLKETLERLGEIAARAPLVVLTSLDDVDVGSRALLNGAQDYLAKADLDSERLHRTIRYAIERGRVVAALEARNQELQRFAHTLSHELRTPLNTVAVTLRLLEESVGDDLDDDMRDTVANAAEAVQGMDELIEGLLRYARAGGSELEFRDVSLRDVVRQAWDGLAARVRREGAQLETGSLPTLAGDSTLLRVLFANLFENALKYRGDDAPRVRVEGTSEGGTATLTVADNGSGLTGEALERAFEPFVRGAVAGSPGSGVGLATCRRIVERHGGAIDLTTRPGHGTTFRIELPVAHRDGAGGSRSRRR